MNSITNSTLFPDDLLTEEARKRKEKREKSLTFLQKQGVGSYIQPGTMSADAKITSIEIQRFESQSQSSMVVYEKAQHGIQEQGRSLSERLNVFTGTQSGEIKRTFIKEVQTSSKDLTPEDQRILTLLGQNEPKVKSRNLAHERVHCLTKIAIDSISRPTKKEDSLMTRREKSSGVRAVALVENNPVDFYKIDEKIFIEQEFPCLKTLTPNMKAIEYREQYGLRDAHRIHMAHTHLLASGLEFIETSSKNVFKLLRMKNALQDPRPIVKMLSSEVGSTAGGLVKKTIHQKNIDHPFFHSDCLSDVKTLQVAEFYSVSPKEVCQYREDSQKIIETTKDITLMLVGRRLINKPISGLAYKILEKPCVKFSSSIQIIDEKAKEVPVTETLPKTEN